jgi:hypothetical protein
MVQVDHSDGTSIWVFDRCGSTECTNSTIAPIQKFDSSGKFQIAFGAGSLRSRIASTLAATAKCERVTKLPRTARARILSSSAPMAVS